MIKIHILISTGLLEYDDDDDDDDNVHGVNWNLHMATTDLTVSSLYSQSNTVGEYLNLNLFFLTWKSDSVRAKGGRNQFANRVWFE